MANLQILHYSATALFSQRKKETEHKEGKEERKHHKREKEKKNKKKAFM